jgi:hypothetical protein
MNLVWHQFKKDVRYLLHLLILGLIVLILRLFELTGTQFGWFSYLGYLPYVKYEMSLDVLQFIIVGLLVAKLIHNDPIVGTNAFWTTRPISQSLLIKSKSCVIIIFLILAPIFAELIILAFNQFTGLQLFQAFLEMFTIYTSWAVVVTLIATLTENLSKCVIMGLAIFVTIYCFSYIADKVDFLNRIQFINATNLSLAESRKLINRCFLILIGGSIVLYQYQSHYRKHSLLFSLGLLIGWVAIPYAWPIDFLEVKPKSTSIDYLEDLKLNFDTDKIFISASPYSYKDRTLSKVIHSPLYYTHPNSNLDLELFRATAKLQLSDGKTLTLRSERAEYPQPNEKPLQAAIGNQFQVYKLGEENLHRIFTLKNQDFYEYKENPGQLKVNLEFSLLRYQKTAELELRPGAKWQRGAQKIEITEIEKNKWGIRIIFNYQWANLDLRPQRFDKSRTDDFYYLLVNKKTHQAIWVDEDANMSKFILNPNKPRLNQERCSLRFYDEDPSETTHSSLFALIFLKKRVKKL